jgi:uncharacterized protein
MSSNYDIVPSEGTIVLTSDTNLTLSGVLFGRTRQKVLGLLYGHPDETFHLRHVARRTGQALGAVQRELAQLTAVGILEREQLGNQAHFRANPRCPIYAELKALVTKTIGAAAVLREALLPLGERIRLAFLFGSLARGEQRRESDIDVIVVGDLSFDELSQAVTLAERRLARPVNPMLYSPAEFERKRVEGNHFLTRVLDEPKIMLIGDAHHELGPLV